MIEVAICQPDCPNQAIFLSSLDIKLEDFRTSITKSGLDVPEEWVFMTRLGSLISEDQEDRIFLTSVKRDRDDSDAVDVMIAPPLSQLVSLVPFGMAQLQPFGIAAAVAVTVLIVLNFGALDGLEQKSSLSTVPKHPVCGIPGDIDPMVELAKMQRQIDVEMGFFECNESIYKIQVSFQKANFTEVPQLVFAQSSINNAGDLFSFEMDDLHVSQTGFNAQCSVRGRKFTSLRVSWIAAGK